MEGSKQMNILAQCIGYMAWLQIRFARLGKHGWADLLGELMESLDKQANHIEGGGNLVNEQDLIELSQVLEPLLGDDAIITEFHIDMLRNCVRRVCEKKEICFKKSLLIRKEDIKLKISEIARQLKNQIQPENTIFLGVLKGSIFFLVDLLREIDFDVKFDFIEAKSYGTSMNSSKEVKFTKITEMDFANKIVVIVEDIVDTGFTMNEVLKLIYQKNPSKVITCVLIDKYERREVDVQIDYFGFRIEKGFVVGYGLDFADQFRCLPDIYTLEKV